MISLLEWTQKKIKEKEEYALWSWLCELEIFCLISFFQFIEEINDKLDDKETPEGLRRIFDLFSDGTDVIKKENVVDILGQIAKEYNDPQLHEALDRCAKNANNLTFEKFESIITKKQCPWLDPWVEKKTCIRIYILV